MTTIYLTQETHLTGDYAATIGFFDGVHRGHQYLVKQLREQAAVRGLQSMVVTFDRHPRQVVQPDWQPLQLSTAEEKEQLLAETGVEKLVVLPFDKQMASLTALDFMRKVLKEQLSVSMLLTGYDNHFGHRQQGKTEGFDDYVRYGKETGIDVICGAPFYIPGCTNAVSSSLVRRLLNEGRVGEATLCLGRPYELCGIVEHGEQMGRKMAFPTANISVDSCRMIPKRGVYAVRVLGNPKSNTSWKMGMTNIGLRPTFDGHKQTIETHIFDFNGDLYGQQLSIQFVARLRDEQSFENAEALVRQMQADEQAARKILTSYPSPLTS